jgi:hypothetical protein
VTTDPVIARLMKLAAKAGLADVEESTSYGTPALKVAGKLLMRIKDAEALVFRCPMPEKELLMEAAPDIYFETDHYKGWPYVLVRRSAANDAELTRCLERAWLIQAPRRLLVGTPKAKARPKRTLH